MNKIILTVFVFFILVSVFISSDFVDYRDYVMEDSYEEAFSLAGVLGKGVVLIFSLPGCGQCEDLKTYTLSNSSVKDILTDKYVMTTVDKNEELMGFFPPNPKASKYRMQYDYSSLYDMYEIRLTPTMIFLDEEFNRIGRVEGFLPVEKLIDSIEMISLGIEKNIKNISYLSQNDFKVLNEFANLYRLVPLEELDKIREFDENALYVAEKEESVYLEEIVGKYPSIRIIISDDKSFGHITSNENAKKSEAMVIAKNESTVICEDTGLTQIVTPSQAKKIIEENLNNESFMIIDLRTPQEFDAGHLNNAVNLDFFSSEFENTLKKLNRDRTYLIYCKSGGRSTKAYSKMVQLGFKKVYHMCEGYEGWINGN